MTTDPRPVFVIGSPRSGTSVLTWCLGQHPNLLALEETVWLAKAVVELGVVHAAGSDRGERSHLSAAGIGLEAFLAETGRAFDRISLAHRDRLPVAGESDDFALRRSPEDPKARWVDGTPENSFVVLGLHLLFPQARFIHLVRDVSSVVRSLVSFSRAGGVDMTPADAWSRWYDCVGHGLRAERALGSSVIARVRHDQLVTDPEATLRRCLAHVGEDFHPDCLRPLRHRINSSRVPELEDASLLTDGVDPDLRRRAEALAAEALDATTTFAGDASERAELAEALARRVQSAVALPSDRARALERLRRLEEEKAEAQAWALALQAQVERLTGRLRQLQAGADSEAAR